MGDSGKRGDFAFLPITRAGKLRNYSTPIESRGILTKRNAELEAKYLPTIGKEESKAPEIPRPDWWGGFDVVPESIEFWQGQSNRIHDRIVFYAPHAEKLQEVPREYRN